MGRVCCYARVSYSSSTSAERCRCIVARRNTEISMKTFNLTSYFTSGEYDKAMKRDNAFQKAAKEYKEILGKELKWREWHKSQHQHK